MRWVRTRHAARQRVEAIANARGSSRWLVLGVVVLLGGCGSTSAWTETGGGTIEGVILQVGGPESPGQTQPRSVPIDAIAAVYAGIDGGGRPTGHAVAEVHSSARDGGRFSLHLQPGNYYLVVERDAGLVISTPQHVRLAAGDSVSITLKTFVP